MRVELVIAVLVAAYVLGSFPVGLLVVKLLRGRDIRYWFSGRTGGTNVMRMAGFWAGLFTTLIDFGKGTLAVLLARSLTGGQHWIEVGAGLLAILGHNHSIFLPERNEGKLRLRGGAGGATTGGAVFGFWPPAILILIPIGVGMLYGVGYASLATMSIGLTSTLIFLWRVLTGQGPWAHVFFAVVAEALLLLALRPNIERLLKGEERLVGWRARKAQQKEQAKQVGGNAHA